jgi:hypothetical protein
MKNGEELPVIRPVFWLAICSVAIFGENLSVEEEPEWKYNCLADLFPIDKI